MYSRRPEAVETGAEDGGADSARGRPKLAILCSCFYHLEEPFRIGLLPAPESLHVRETISRSNTGGTGVNEKGTAKVR